MDIKTYLEQNFGIDDAVGDVSASSIDSGTADDGDVLTADGSGGAEWRTPTAGDDVTDIRLVTGECIIIENAGELAVETTIHYKDADMNPTVTASTQTGVDFVVIDVASYTLGADYEVVAATGSVEDAVALDKKTCYADIYNSQGRVQYAAPMDPGYMMHVFFTVWCVRGVDPE